MQATIIVIPTDALTKVLGNPALYSRQAAEEYLRLYSMFWAHTDGERVKVVIAGKNVTVITNAKVEPPVPQSGLPKLADKHMQELAEMFWFGGISSSGRGAADYFFKGMRSFCLGDLAPDPDRESQFRWGYAAVHKNPDSRALRAMALSFKGGDPPSEKVSIKFADPDTQLLYDSVVAAEAEGDYFRGLRCYCMGREQLSPSAHGLHDFLRGRSADFLRGFATAAIDLRYKPLRDLGLALRKNDTFEVKG